jgi:tripartite-type tricarboxylate transporter receptor subunit TctC
MLRLPRLLATALLLAGALCAHAQSNYPNKPIKMIVPLAAGSVVDNAARTVARKRFEGLGQSIVIENVPGSAGLIGGHNDSVLTMIPHIYKQVPWRALTDFDPISRVAAIE